MDGELARRIELAEAAAGEAFVRTRRRLSPERGSTWFDVGGARAFFDAVDSPLNQSFGLGVSAPATADQLAAIEAFFAERRVDTMHEVCSLAGVGVLALLVERGYRPVEASTVLVRAIQTLPVPASALVVRRCERGDRDAWVATAVAGWSEHVELAHVMEAVAHTAFENEVAASFLVEQGGVPVATGSLLIVDGIAIFAGASTIPAARGRGAQALLLAARLAEAHRRGCDLAMIVADPGSTSQRNAERGGFRVAYTRTKWRRVYSTASESIHSKRTEPSPMPT
jgi:hypothetical protein